MFTNMTMQDVDFCALNKQDATSIVSVLENDDFDLVVHTAGPFQGKLDVTNGVLEACLAKRVPYIDVCDDYCTARAAKAKFAKVAQESGVPCIISTGCWVRALLLVDSLHCAAG
jgi:saccharopine dehydrogenase-like NADP-dependent oxidoreductase